MPRRAVNSDQCCGSNCVSLSVVVGVISDIEDMCITMNERTSELILGHMNLLVIIHRVTRIPGCEKERRLMKMAVETA